MAKNTDKSKKPKVRAGGIEPGRLAPDFTLCDGPERMWSLAAMRGGPVILAFYPADFSPVCGEQLALYNEILDEFQKFGARLVGISVDGPWCHQAYAAAQRLEFSLLADFEPKGAVARRYGVYRARDGVCERALFVIDGRGVVRWKHISPIEINPGAEGILAALEALPSEKTA